MREKGEVNKRQAIPWREDAWVILDSARAREKGGETSRQGGVYVHLNTSFKDSERKGPTKPVEKKVTDALLGSRTKCYAK